MGTQKPSLKSLSTILSSIFSIIAVILTIVMLGVERPDIQAFLSVGVALLSVIFTVVAVGIVLKKGKPRNVIILGPEGSGKTTYFAVLTSRLLQGAFGDKYRVLFNDQESKRLWSRLYQEIYEAKRFPEPTTEPQKVRLSIERQAFITSQRVDLDFIDYPWEQIQEFPSEIDFTNINGIIFFIDVSDVLSEETQVKIEKYLNPLYTLMKITSGRNGKSSIPTAIVISKSDLLSEREEPEQLLERTFQELLSFSHTTMSNYKYFLVSSVGAIQQDVEGKAIIKQEETFGVEKPFEWMFNNLF